jgi:hypothetical protein
MEAQISLKLKPFTVPNFVTVEPQPGKRQDGFKPALTYSLEALETETLERLCDEFVAAVFKKAELEIPQKYV